MALSNRWQEIQDGLGDDWEDVRLALFVNDPRKVARAAALLTPLTPGKRGNRLSFTVHRRGQGPSPGAVTLALERLADEEITGRLRVLGSTESPAQALPARRSLADAWARELDGLPSDWSDLHGELELTSSDHLDRAALLVAPLNPTRVPAEPAFRFRAARRFGYGAAPEMVRRGLERLDAEDIRGELRILRVLSDTKPVSTQGPVWYVGGRAV